MYYAHRLAWNYEDPISSWRQCSVTLEWDHIGINIRTGTVTPNYQNEAYAGSGVSFDFNLTACISSTDRRYA